MNEINYFEAQRRLNRQTAYLYFLFGLNLLVAALVSNYIVLFVQLYQKPAAIKALIAHSIGPIPLYSNHSIAVAVFVLGVMIVAYFYALMSRSSGASIAEQAGGVEVMAVTDDPKLKQLYEVVNEIALASVIPTPRIYLLEGSRGINAFAAGRDRNEAVIAVTPDALDLSRAELQALIAHEVGHIASEDVKLNWRSIAVLGAFMSLTSVGIYLLSRLRYIGGQRNRDARLILFVVGISLLMIVVGYIFYLIGRLIQSKISKQREYYADLNAVVAMRQGMPMISLLRKLQESDERGHIPIRSECAHFLFSSNHLTQLFDTHPPLQKRIDAIFEHVSDLEMKEYLAARRQEREREKAIAAEREAEAAAVAEAEAERIEEAQQPLEWEDPFRDRKGG